MLLPPKPALSSLPFAAFKLFILYLWFGALRKILIFYLSPLARSGAGREGGLCIVGCLEGAGAMPGQCPPAGLSCQCAHLPGLHPEEMYHSTSTRAPLLPGTELEDCSPGWEQN